MERAKINWRTTVSLSALGAAIAGGLLPSRAFAQAQDDEPVAPDGYVRADEIEGVTVVEIRSDGSALLTLESGETVVIAAADVELVGGVAFIEQSGLSAAGLIATGGAGIGGLPIILGAAGAGGLAAAAGGGDGGGDPAGEPPAPPPPPANSAPEFTSAAAFDAPENQTSAFTAEATDADGDTLTYAISGGADAERFQIDANSGEVSFLAAPDFEAPGDADGDNAYELEITVSDGQGGETSQAVTVTVTDVDETPPPPANSAPEFTSAAAFDAAENQTGAFTAEATDPDGDTLTYAISGGADAALFSIDAATGAVSFLAAPDFEAPGDADGDNAYELEITVSDGQGGETSQAVTVTVTDVDENEAPVITSAAAFDAAENQTAAFTATAADPDGDTLTYAISGGADAALFSIDAATGAVSFLAAPDFEAPGDADGDNAFELEITASDGQGGETSQAVTVTVTDENEAPVIAGEAAVSVPENTTPIGAYPVSDPEGAGVTVTLSGPDASLFVYDDATGALSFISPRNFEAPTDSGQNNVYDVTLTADDGVSSSSLDIAVTVTDVNEAPPPIPNRAPNFGPALFEFDDVRENQTTVGTAAANDPDNDALSYSLSGADAGLFSIDNNGVITFVNAPDLETPGDDDSDGVYEFTVTATDPDGLSDSADVEVTVVEDPATFTPPAPAGSVIEDGGAGNDTASGTVTVSDSDGVTEESFDPVDPADLEGIYGDFTLAISGDQANWSYTLDNAAAATNALRDGETVQDVLTLTSLDGTTVDIVVTITGANEAAVIGALTASYTEDDQSGPSVQIPGTLTITDVDTGEESFQPITGATALNGAVMFDLQADGSYTLTIDNDAAEIQSLAGGAAQDVDFTVTALDGTQATFTLTITGVNDDPEANDDTALSTTEDAPLVGIDVLANDGDVDASTTLEITQINGTGIIDGGAAIDLAGDGSVSLSGGLLTFDPDGDFEALGDGDTRAVTFDYTVSDGAGGTDTASVEIEVTGVNDAPTFTNAPLAGAIDVTEGDTAVIDLNAVDAESDPLTFSILPSSEDVSALSIDPDSGVITFNASAALSGSFDGDDVYEITVRVDDDNDGVDFTDLPLQITVLPSNQPPVFTDSLGDSFNAEENDDTSVIADFSAADPDAGDTLTFGIKSPTGPAEEADGALFTIDANTGELRFDSPQDFENSGDDDGDGDYELVVTVSDGTETVERAITVTLIDENEAPTAAAGVLSTDEDNPSALVDLAALGSDPDTGDGAALVIARINGNPVAANDVVTLASGATVTISSDGRSVSYDPNGEFEDLAAGGPDGTDSFNFTLADPDGLESNPVTQDVTVTGANDAPTAQTNVALDFDGADNSSTDNSLDESETETVTLSIDAGDIVGPNDTGLLASDVDSTLALTGLTLTGASVTVNGGAAVNVDQADLSNHLGLEYNDSTGVLTFNGTYDELALGDLFTGDTAVVTVDFTVTDGGASDTGSFTYEVAGEGFGGVLIVNTASDTGADQDNVDGIVGSSAFGSGIEAVIAAEQGDGGGLSLREAVAIAEAFEGTAEDVTLIRFDEAVFDATGTDADRTITLEDAAQPGGQANNKWLAINSAVEIDGLVDDGMGNEARVIIDRGGDGSAIRQDSDGVADDDLLVLRNLDFVGGGVFAHGDVLIENTLLAGCLTGVNTNGGPGGAHITLVDSVISGNGRSGAVIDDGDTLIMIDSVIEGNGFTARDQSTGGREPGSVGDEVGAGLRLRGEAVIINSVIANNKTDRDGGAIWLGEGTPVNLNDISLTLINSTLAGNQADDGAAIYVGDTSVAIDATVRVINSTITGNVTTQIGAAHTLEFAQADADDSFTVVNSVIAGNAVSRPNAVDNDGRQSQFDDELSVNITASNSLIGDTWIGANLADPIQSGLSVSEIFAQTDVADANGDASVTPGEPAFEFGLPDANQNGHVPINPAGPAVDIGDGGAQINLDETALGVDLNGNGNTTDTFTTVADLPSDAAGNPRVEGPDVDAGALEATGAVVYEDPSTSGATIRSFSIGDERFVWLGDGDATETFDALGGIDTFDASQMDDNAGHPGARVDLDGGEAARVDGSYSDQTGTDDGITGFVNIIGSDSNDRLSGNGVANRIDGRDGDDEISGGAGDDVLIGGAGADTINGESDADTLTGGLGDDALDGGEGADTLIGGDGGDNLSGGLGDDVFLYGAANHGHDDIILDFAQGDVIRLDAAGANASVSSVGGGSAFLTLTDGGAPGTITLTNLDPAVDSVDDFVLTTGTQNGVDFVEISLKADLSAQSPGPLAVAGSTAGLSGGAPAAGGSAPPVTPPMTPPGYQESAPDSHLWSGPEAVGASTASLLTLEDETGLTEPGLAPQALGPMLAGERLTGVDFNDRIFDRLAEDGRLGDGDTAGWTPPAGGSRPESVLTPFAAAGGVALIDPVTSLMELSPADLWA